MRHARRPVDLVVISDLHLGSAGCQADSLLAYLREVQPRILVLNGDIIDFWQLARRPAWSPSHTAVVEEVLRLSRQGVRVYYLTGNHDDVLRRYSGRGLGRLQLRDKLLLDLGGQRVWIFHGDVFDLALLRARWIARWGGVGYDLLIRLNRSVNRALVALGGRPYSLAAKVKQGVKQAVRFVGDFEATATSLAFEQGYDVVICGHIHVPCNRMLEQDGRSLRYLNAGDWIESLSAIEYTGGHWHLHRAQDEVAAALALGPLAQDAPPPPAEAAAPDLAAALRLVNCTAVDLVLHQLAAPDLGEHDALADVGDPVGRAL